MTKEFVYTKVQDLGKIGDKTVEIGQLQFVLLVKQRKSESCLLR